MFLYLLMSAVPIGVLVLSATYFRSENKEEQKFAKVVAVICVLLWVGLTYNQYKADMDRDLLGDFRAEEEMYDQGYEDGYDSGYDEGYHEGLNDGYDIGYDDCYEEYEEYIE